ncbi:MAG: folate-binding protein YgfZ [Lentimonas sp.]|jgi:folate-binding protein YgfZ
MKSIFGYEYEPAAHLLVTDEDAADFLQSQFSNELRPFDAGRCTYGLWLNVKGKVIADSVVFCEGDERFRILSEYSAAAVIAQKLEQHIIADDVEIEAQPTGAALALIGEGAVEALEAVGFPVPAVGTFATVRGVTIYRGRRSLELSFELWSGSAATIAELKARLIELGVDFIPRERVQLIRIAAGVASVPSEIGPGDLPGEGALVGNGVSLTKGCYLGQEVVSRMYNLGRPQRGLFQISGSGSAPNDPIALYNEESKKIGELRSAFSTENGWQGVALLKSRYAVVGESLNHEAGSVKIEGLFQSSQGGAE